jgi:biotin transport system substrate-specific component
MILGLIKIVFCLAVMYLATFSQITFLQYNFSESSFVPYEYSLIYISVFALSLAFRVNYAFVAVIIYLLAGLIGLPLFAYGGGWTYIFEPSFGYLLGLLPLSLITFLHKHFSGEFAMKSFNGKSLGPLMGILIAHGFGMFFLALTGRLSLSSFMCMSSYQLFYDLFLSYLLVMIFL